MTIGFPEYQVVRFDFFIYGAVSLSGPAAIAWLHGATETVIISVTGHKSAEMVCKYIPGSGLMEEQPGYHRGDLMLY